MILSKERLEEGAGGAHPKRRVLPQGGLPTGRRMLGARIFEPLTRVLNPFYRVFRQAGLTRGPHL